MSENNIHADHRKRMKSKFLEHGMDVFSDHEVLEYLLFYSIPRQDTNVIGHELMEKFGSFSKVFDADIEQLCKIKGLSEHSALLIKSIPQIARRYLTAKQSDRVKLDDYRLGGEYFVTKFIGMTEERFYAAYLDNSMNVIDCVLIADGDINSVGVNIKKLVTEALLKKASSVIVAHNHPDGSIIPSEADLGVTKTVIAALKILGINFVEHYIISGNKYMGINSMKSSLDY